MSKRQSFQTKTKLNTLPSESTSDSRDCFPFRSTEDINLGGLHSPTFKTETLSLKSQDFKVPSEKSTRHFIGDTYQRNYTENSFSETASLLDIQSNQLSQHAMVLEEENRALRNKLALHQSDLEQKLLTKEPWKTFVDRIKAKQLINFVEEVNWAKTEIKEQKNIIKELSKRLKQNDKTIAKKDSAQMEISTNTPNMHSTQMEHETRLDSSRSYKERYQFLEKEYEQLKTQYNTQQSHFNTLQSQLGSLQQQHLLLQQNQTNMQSINSNSQTQVDSLQTENNNLQVKINHLQAQYSQLKLLREQQAKRRQDLNRQLEDKNIKLRAVEADVAALQIDRQQSEKHQKLLFIEMEKSKDLLHKNEHQVKEIQGLRELIKTLREKEKTWQSEQQEHQKMIHEAETARQTKEQKAHQEVRKLTFANQSLIAQVEKLTDKMKGLQNKQPKMSQTDIYRLEQSNNRLSLENNKLKICIDQMAADNSSLQQSETKLLNRMESLQRDFTAVNEKCSKEIDQKNQIDKELSELYALNDKLQQQKIELQISLRDAAHLTNASQSNHSKTSASLNGFRVKKINTRLLELCQLLQGNCPRQHLSSNPQSIDYMLLHVHHAAQAIISLQFGLQKSLRHKESLISCLLASYVPEQLKDSVIHALWMMEGTNPQSEPEEDEEEEIKNVLERIQSEARKHKQDAEKQIRFRAEQIDELRRALADKRASNGHRVVQIREQRQENVPYYNHSTLPHSRSPLVELTGPTKKDIKKKYNL